MATSIVSTPINHIKGANKYPKINSIEKIYLGNLKLRHFVTDEKNELYEDNKGNIYVVADKKGIYRVNFSDFR